MSNQIVSTIHRQYITSRHRLPFIRDLRMKYIIPPLLLTISNLFMTFAWYGHLKHKQTALWIAILASWGIALFEYCFQVPANRIGHGTYSAAQLKIMQEAITLIVFAGFALFYLHEPPRKHELLGMILVFIGVLVAQFGGGPRLAP